MIAKELTDNALDEDAACRVGLLDDNGFFVEDDGDGIQGTDEEIASLFSIGRPLRSSKLLRKPRRGALGNGLRVVAGAVLSTDGTLIVATGGRTLKLTPQSNGRTLAERIGPYEGPGTRIEVRLGASLKVRGDALRWAEEAIALAVGESKYAGKTSPHWYNSDSFFELLLAAANRTVRDVMEDFDGCTGKKAGEIAADFKGRLANTLTRAEAEALLIRARSLARIVKPERLGCIGSTAEGLPASYAKLVGTYKSKTGIGKLQADIPFVVEAYAEIAEQEWFRVSVNRSPIAADMETFYGKDMQFIAGCGIEAQFTVGRRPFRVWLNVDSPYMPVTTDGKSPDLSPMFGRIQEVVNSAIKRAKRRASGGSEDKPPTTKDIVLEYLDAAIDKASGEGTYRFSIRQLYYAVRPYVIDSLSLEPEYNYFSKVITEYEAALGDIAGMYRDPRGTVYHPHTGEEIQLGTIQVESYRRPRYGFNKVLYCEKEGIFPILKETKWPERHDCALMTSKGFASRAARDLLDLLGETDEELYVFCIHDADAAGTMIFQSLQDGTKARPGRNVKIINLGLEPDEADEMGLQVEELKRKDNRRIAVADYVAEDWQDWLQSNRVELNAMTTPQLLEWLDRKFEDHVGKLVPPKDVLAERLEQGVRFVLKQQFEEQVLREANIAARVEEAIRERQPQLRAQLETIQEDVSQSLSENPTEHWTSPVGSLAQLIAGPELWTP